MGGEFGRRVSIRKGGVRLGMAKVDMISEACGNPVAEAAAELLTKWREPGSPGFSARVEYLTAQIQLLLSDLDQPDEWLYCRIGVTGQDENVFLGREIGPLMRRLEMSYPVRGWWWLRKSDVLGPALRLRINLATEWFGPVTTEIRNSLASSAESVGVLKYEPEVCLFGGPVGMRLAHEIFCAESKFLTECLMISSSEHRHIIPTAASLALTFRLFRACGLDIFECWDVFARIKAKRLQPARAEAADDPMRRLVATSLDAGLDEIAPLLGNEAAALMHNFDNSLTQIADHLKHAYYGGLLETGLRQLLAPLVIFHWNRNGFSYPHQCALACAAVDELACRSRKGSD
jgi:thiopeptide-type bacteriocin biosynthesis protein